MKKLLILLTFASFMFVSCVKDDDKLFNESPSERLNKSEQAAKSILTGAANGWLMEYYPSPTQDYGGYNLVVKFKEENKATVASEIADADRTEDSFYDVVLDGGPILTFNTYNPLMHYFSQPRNPDGIGPEDSGMRGDYEFVILNATPDSVILKGKKTGNKIVMTPLKSDKSWKDHITAMQQAYDDMDFLKYIYVVDKDTVQVSISYRKLTFTYTENEETKTTAAPFIPTLTGYKLYSVLDVKGVRVDEFVFDKTQGTSGIFVPANGAQSRLVPVDIGLNELFVSSSWYFKYSDMGATTALYWSQAGSKLNAIGEEMLYANMGMSGNNYAFMFGCSDGGGTYRGALYFNYKLESNNEIGLTFASGGDSNGAWYYNNANFNYIVATLNGSTFTLTADHPRKPAWIKLQSKTSSSNYMTLYKNTVSRPFNN